MSTTGRPATRLLLLGVLLAPAGAAGPAGEGRPNAAGTVTRGADLALLDAVRDVARAIESLRGEKFERLPLAIRAPDDLRHVLADARVLDALPRERLEARGRAWADIGFGERTTPVRLYEIVAADIAGIGWDSHGRRLLVAPDRLEPTDFVPQPGNDGGATVLLATGVREDEPLVAHVLMHARQRERTGRDVLEPSTDAMLARAAWAEGEANLVALRHLFAGMGLADAAIDAGLDPGEYLGGRLVPRALREERGALAALLRFIYSDGFALASAEFAAGGYPALDAAMRSRTSTRAMLHPERSLDGVWQGPEDPAPPREGLRLADRDRLGEQAVIALVSSATGKDNLALLAGDGWNGDALHRWEPQGGGAGDGITEWITRWTSERTAADFEYAMRRVLGARFEDSAWREVAGGEVVLDAAGRTHRIGRAGRQVRVIVGPLQPEKSTPGAA